MNDLIKGTGRLKVEKYKVPLLLRKNEDKLIYQIEQGIIDPDDIIVSPPNDWFTAGWNLILNLITGQSSAFYSNSKAQIGVGNSDDAFDDGDSTLQGTESKFKGMMSEYPDTPASGQVNFRSKFTTSEANFQWEEWGIRGTTDNLLWNRGLTGGGGSWLKDSTLIWIATATLGKS